MQTKATDLGPLATDKPDKQALDKPTGEFKGGSLPNGKRAKAQGTKNSVVTEEKRNAERGNLVGQNETTDFSLVQTA